MRLSTWAPAQSDRCGYGYAPAQHPGLCRCQESEWAVFRAAVVASVRPDGTVHQSDVRPRIKGRIEPKHIGGMYRRAKNVGLLVDTGEVEQSTDVGGRNTDKFSRIYRVSR
jgi:hypothetical protein